MVITLQEFFDAVNVDDAWTKYIGHVKDSIDYSSNDWNNANKEFRWHTLLDYLKLYGVNIVDFEDALKSRYPSITDITVQVKPEHFTLFTLMLA